MQTHPDPASVPFTLADLYSLDRLAAAFPNQVTKAALRWQLRHRTTNGLAPAVVRQGRQLQIVKPRYEAWLATRAGAV